VVEIRAFQRRDREQLTELVNAHIAAVVPGWAVSVSALLSQLEREPGQYVVDPWVVERAALVGLRRDRVVAGAYLKRYASDGRVTPDYSGAGEIAWLVCLPQAQDVGRALAAACNRQLDDWQVTRQWADGSLPTSATFGVPDAWPHVAAVLRSAGFDDGDGRTEILLAGTLDEVAEPGPPPLPGLSVRREVGHLTTCFSAVLGGEVIGYAHVKDDLTKGGTLLRMAGWAEMWELRVDPNHRNQGVATWLVRTAVAWLRLGGATRMLADVAPDMEDPAMDRFYARFGWHEIGRSRRGWRRQLPATG
jgi:GNAT superfamily N-acetyltransferase